MSMCWPWPETAQRSHVDNLGLDRSGTFASAPAHPFQSFTADEKWPACVGGKNRIPLLDRQLLELRSLIVRGIVHQDVDASELATDLLHHGSYACFFGHVATESESPDPMCREVDDCLSGLARGLQECDRDISAGFG